MVTNGCRKGRCALNGIFSCLAPFSAAPRGAAGMNRPSKKCPGAGFYARDSGLESLLRERTRPSPASLEILMKVSMHMMSTWLMDLSSQGDATSPAKPSPVSEHRESDDHQSKDARRDNRFRCPIHYCLRQASGRRDASLAGTVVHRVDARQPFRTLSKLTPRAGVAEIPAIPVPTERRAFRQSAGCHSSLYRCPRAACRRGCEARRTPASAAGVAAHVEEVSRPSPWDCAASDSGGLGLMSVRMRTLLPSIRSIDRPGRVVTEAKRRTGIREASPACRRNGAERRARVAACQTVYVRGIPEAANACVRAARGYERVSRDAEGTRCFLCRREVVITAIWSFEAKDSTGQDQMRPLDAGETTVNSRERRASRHGVRGPELLDRR